ncbi:hypothetical protein AB0F88_16705 [Streptosporangium sp. NPDC023963]|uniref:hypothetical protein n=1 Tax=Streptosporangium sp. NPDC023963 TaxID=3155608 RepID=UPI0034158DC9
MHHPTTSRDHRGEDLPALACNTGIAGWDVSRLHVTHDPVDCRRCLRLVGAAPPPDHMEVLTLFDADAA